MSNSNPQKETIERCPHDSEHPYAQILNEILRHKTLSVESIWLLSYLLSHSGTWKIIIPQIVKHVKGRMGRDRVYAVINELIEFGYMQRVPIKKGNLHQGFKYFVSEKAKFKKCFRHPDFQDTEIQHAENQHSKEQPCSKKTIYKEQQQEPLGSVAPLKSRVVVSSSLSEEDEENADKAAEQYIASERKRGNPVKNEAIIRRRALRDKWKPNVDPEDEVKLKRQKKEKLHKLSEANKQKIEKLISLNDHLFTKSFRLISRESVVELVFSKGVQPLDYARSDFWEIVNDYIENFKPK